MAGRRGGGWHDAGRFSGVGGELVRETTMHTLVERLAEAAACLNRQLHSGRLDQWEDLGLTLPHVKVLVLLEHEGPLRMGAISSHVGTALSATTAVVDRLVDMDLVERTSDPHDRRAVICGLTDLGRAAAERFWRVGGERVENMVARLEPGRVEAAVEALECLCRAGDDLPTAFLQDTPSA